MSRAIPHFVTVVESPGQPASVYTMHSKTSAMNAGAAIHLGARVGCVVTVYKGKPTDNVSRDPVKVWS